MNESDIPRIRLASQGISGIGAASPQEAVRRLGAVQAQSLGQVLWAIGLRTRRPSLSAVEDAIRRGRIVQTWPNRGTLHFVPAEDAAWMMRLLSPRSLATAVGRWRQLGLDESVFARARGVVERALEGGRRLSRPAIRVLLSRAGVDTAGQRAYHILWYLGQIGLICFGPPERRQQTFVLLDEWVRKPRVLERDEALGELCRRYFSGHSPATIHDFASWAGLTLADARRGVAVGGSKLGNHAVEGRDYLSAIEPDHSTGAPAEMHLLPGFDEFLLGYRDRRAVLRPSDAFKVAPGGNGIFKPIVVVNGKVVGTWKRAARKDSVEVAAELFAQPVPDREEFRSAAQRYADFLGLPLHLGVNT